MQIIHCFFCSSVLSILLETDHLHINSVVVNQGVSPPNRFLLRFLATGRFAFVVSRLCFGQHCFVELYNEKLRFVNPIIILPTVYSRCVGLTKCASTFILTVPRRYFCCGSFLFLLSVFILWFIYYVSDIFCKF